MRSSSADRGTGAATAQAPDGPVLGRWARLVLGTLLVGAALLGPAVGYASAQFGSEATVTISITVPPTTAPTATPTAEPTATLDPPPDLP
jgi:hypothetical protein